MTTSENVDKDYFLWVLLDQTRDAIFRLREDELSQFGVTVGEAGLLFVIQMLGENATPARISQWALRQHHTVSALLKRMENKGLIMRTKDPVKRNTWKISLTEKGQDINNQSGIRDSLHAAMSVISEKEQKQLYKLLVKLRDNAIQHASTVKVPFPQLF